MMEKLSVTGGYTRKDAAGESNSIRSVVAHKDLVVPPLFIQTTIPSKKPASRSDLMSVIIGWVLLGGVILSAAVILAGVILLFIQRVPLNLRALQSFPLTFGQVWAGVIALQPQAIIAFGLLLLIATPIMRVAVSIVAFAFEKDRRYVVITTLVLAILLISIFIVGYLLAGTANISTFQTHFSLQVMLFIFASSIIAGLLGSLVGLGGGVLIVPLLTLGLGFPISLAIGASIISVIATSSGAAAAYVRDHLTNLRIGMVLEIATTTGAISGAFLAGLLAPQLLFIIFGVILLISAVPLVVKVGEELPKGVKNDKWANWLRLSCTYPDQHLGRDVSYQVTRTPLGAGMMYVAGLISGLLGIGSGTFKVIAMDVLMRLPMKVSTTTSNFMIGVTAAASAGIYFSRGDIRPLMAAPVALGILLGALIGARLLVHLSNRTLRMIFVPVIIMAALEMVLHGLGVGLL